MRKFIVLLGIILSGCGGGGGSSTSTNVAQAISCTLKTYSSYYPESFLGSNSIPTPTEKFDSNIMRGMGLKDYYPSDNNNCATFQEHTRLLYSHTLNRLKAIGVDTVEIYQYGPVNDFSESTWAVSDSKVQIPKTELAWFIQEAHNKNLKVTMVWQLWGVDSKGVWLNVNDPTESETVIFLRGWKNIIVDFAKFSAENKVDNLNIYWNAFSYPVTKYPETSTQEFLTIIDDIKSVFRGKLFMGWPRFYDKRLIEKIDAVVIPLTPSNWSYIDDANISVSLLKNRYLDSIFGKYLDFSLYSGMDTKNIPIIWDFNIQSRDKALSQGWVEDGFCIDNANNIIAWESVSCIQKNYKTDFSIQAMAIEGAFQAIKDQTYFKTYGVNFSTGYWHTDTLVAGPEGFPNFSQSIRGKPAENIVKYWYQK